MHPHLTDEDLALHPTPAVAMADLVATARLEAEADDSEGGRRSRSPIVYVRARIPQLIKYGAVSLISTVASLTLLTTLVAAEIQTTGWANLIATLFGAVPSYELNRRWVWPSTGKAQLRQIVPFVGLSLIGLALSSITVWVSGGWTDAAGMSEGGRALVAAAANAVAFGSLWIVQFAICERHLFGDGVAAKVSSSLGA